MMAKRVQLYIGIILAGMSLAIFLPGSLMHFSGQRDGLVAVVISAWLPNAPHPLVNGLTCLLTRGVFGPFELTIAAVALWALVCRHRNTRVCLVGLCLALQAALFVLFLAGSFKAGAALPIIKGFGPPQWLQHHFHLVCTVLMLFGWVRLDLCLRAWQPPSRPI